MIDSATHRGIIVIAIAATVLRLIAIQAFSGSVEETVYEYDQIAQHIAAGRGFSFDMYGDEPVQPTAWLAPFYPALLAAYYRLVGDQLTGMAVLQALAGGLTCWLLGMVGYLTGGRRTGLVAAFIFAVYPEMILMPMKYVAEPWLLIWIMCAVLFGVRYLKTERTGFLLIAGLFSGIAALTKGMALALPLAMIIWIGFQKPIARKRIRNLVLYLLVMTAVVTPWTVRNYIVMDAFIPVRTNFWVNVWRGNHPGATGTPRNFDHTLHDQALTPEYRTIIDPQLQGNEVQREEVYRKLALQHISDDPMRYVGLTVKRIVYFWTIDPTHPLAGHPMYWGPWSVLLILSAIGVYRIRTNIRLYSFWIALFVMTTTVYGLILVLPRYRIPLLPGLMLLAGEGIGYIKERWDARRVA